MQLVNSGERFGDFLYISLSPISSIPYQPRRMPCPLQIFRYDFLPTCRFIQKVIGQLARFIDNLARVTDILMESTNIPKPTFEFNQTCKKYAY